MSLSAYDHCRIVLAGILPQRLDLWEQADRHLVAEHFGDAQLRTLWLMVAGYHEQTGAILSRNAVADIMRQHDAGSVALYEEMWDACAQREVTDAEFAWSLTQVRDLAAHRATATALTQAMEILTQGTTNEDGETRRGHVEARTHVLTSFAEIDSELAKQEAPEGDLRDEGAEMLAEYTADTVETTGFEFGVPALDEILGGLQPGELDLLVGYTSSGKSSLIVQLGWNVAINQGKNVVIATTETLRPQVRRKLVCRHSKLPMFGLPEGIDSQRLKQHTLTPAEAAALPDVINDLTRNPTYGHCYIMQVPRGGTLSSVESRMQRVQRQWCIDLVAMDYLQLFRADRHRASLREELVSIVKEAKQLATTFNDGRGVCLVSPWQINRDGRDRASRQGHYLLDDLSETAESSNSADVIISLLEPDDTNSRYVDLLGQILKNRDGQRTGAGTVDLRVDYATSSFTSRTRFDSLGGLAQPHQHLADPMNLLGPV